MARRTKFASGQMYRAPEQRLRRRGGTQAGRFEKIASRVYEVEHDVVLRNHKEPRR